MSPDDERPGPVRRGASDARADTARLTWLRRGVWTVLGAGVLAFLVEGADLPPDPVLVPVEGAPSDGPDVGGAALPVGPGRLPAVTGSTTPTPTSVSTSSTGPPARPTTSLAPPTSTSSTPAAPTSLAPGTAPPAPVRRPLAGFDEIAFRITGAEGRTFDGAALLADDDVSRRQGLMEQLDLRGYDAMVFRFESPNTGTFFMRNTRIPLSIAFFDLGGRFVSSAEMVPCPDEVERCPSYGPEGPYLHAIEVAAGDLPRLAIGPGAILSFPRR